MTGIDERSRTAAADEDGQDQIGLDTPRSGVATPQPDPQDKRLPGIMSYFNQVRPASFKRYLSGHFNPTGQAGAAPSPAAPQNEETRHNVSPSELPVSPNEPASHSDSSDEGPPPLLHEKLEPLSEKSPKAGGDIHPYPTPPASQRSSLRGVNMSDTGRDGGSARTSSSVAQPHFRQKSASDWSSLRGRRTSLRAPLTNIVTESSVHARHFSNPTSRNPSTCNSPTSHFTLADSGDASTQCASLDQLKKVTNVGAQKSGQSTPTRSLSTAHRPPAEGSDNAAKENGDSLDRTATHTPTQTGAQAPAPKGKLKIKIIEARGLRKSRDPYVVAVFQRSELISGGPHPADESEETPISSISMGSILIQRQSSDSGRPPLAIPMRSRQSSNTSITDYNTFRSRARRSFTNPKWDAEAIL